MKKEIQCKCGNLKLAKSELCDVCDKSRKKEPDDWCKYSKDYNKYYEKMREKRQISRKFKKK